MSSVQLSSAQPRQRGISGRERADVRRIRGTGLGRELGGGHRGRPEKAPTRVRPTDRDCQLTVARYLSDDQPGGVSFSKQSEQAATIKEEAKRLGSIAFGRISGDR